MRIPLFLDLVADTYPDRTAVICGDQQWTYDALRQASIRLGCYLSERSLEHVGFMGVNSPIFPITLFAAGRANLTMAPLNYRLPDDRLRSLVERLAPAILIVDDDMAHRVEDINGVILLKSSKVLEIVKSQTAQKIPPATEDNECAVLLFTSGTSGEPKAALQGHQHLTSYVLQTLEFLGSDEDEATLVSVPPYHIAAVSAVLSSVYIARRIIQLDTFKADYWIKVVLQHQITHAMMVPTMLEQVLDLLRKKNESLPSLRAVAYGGGKMHRTTILNALLLMPNVGFANAYGLTETSSTITVLGPEVHDQARSGDIDAIRRLDSVGLPVPGIELKICDGDGSVLGIGCRGEVWVRGDQVSGNYKGQNLKDQNGWFATRDLGWLDEDGYLFLDGRLDDVIVRGGENISPGEIEEVLRQHPDVINAAIVGTPDAYWGERIVAFMIVKNSISDDEELRQWVRSRLRSTKVPEEFHYCDELPYNETGKLLRRVLREKL